MGNKIFQGGIEWYNLEITIYVLGLNLVLQYLNQIASLLVYALGYAIGILTGA